MRTIPSLTNSERNKKGIYRDTLVTQDEQDRPVSFHIYRPPEGESAEAPIILANGWTAGNEVMSRVALWLAHHDRTAVTFDHHRFANKHESPEQHKMETLAAAAEGTREYLDADQVDIIAHSEGGINSTLYVEREMQRETGTVAKATLFAPAGVIKLSAPQLIVRGAHEMLSMVHHNQIRHLGKLALAGNAVGEYLWKNLGLSLAEIDAIAASHTPDTIAAIHESGIPIGVVGCTDDKFFPDHELRAALPDTIPYKTIHSNHIDFINDRAVRHQVYDFHHALGQQVSLTADSATPAR